MIKYFVGSIFNIKAQAIVNTVNCTGVMGAGLALEYKLRYPEMYQDYKEKCDKKIIRVGEVNYYRSKEIIIVNFPTKDYFKYPSKIQWIEAGLRDFLLTYKRYNIKSIAFPKLGTLNGGLKWDVVKKLMEKYLSQVEAEVYICLDELKGAEGLELKMVNFFNQNREILLQKMKRITAKQKEILLYAKPISRFWQISKFDGIGCTTYEKIFYTCKNAVEKSQEAQMSLFNTYE